MNLSSSVMMLKRCLYMNTPQKIGVCVFLLIKEGDTPTPPPTPLFHLYQVDIKIYRPKYRNESPYGNGEISTPFVALDVYWRRMIVNHLRGKQCRDILM